MKKRMGQNSSANHQTTESGVSSKRRRTELEMLSDESTKEQSIIPKENGVDEIQRGRLRQQNSQPVDHKDVIKRQNCRIKALLEENRELKNRLADLEAQLSVFVEPTKAMVPQKKRSCTEEKKSKKAVRIVERKKPENLELSKNQPLVVASEYPLYQRVVSMENEEITDNVETPSWRLSCVSPLKITKKCANDEDLSDDVFLRRHLKLETEERRRKRWDQQWISEQKRFERARRKQSHKSNSPNSAEKEVSTLFPSIGKVQYIEKTDDIPVVVWGCNVPSFENCEFNHK